MREEVRRLVEAYLEKAWRKLDVAQRLLKSEDWEDAVSRAYYAAFHAAQALLLTEGEEAKTHRGVVTLFSLLFVKTGRLPRHLGKFLANLRDERESGDYEVLSWVDRETAERAVKEAEEFLKEAEHYLKALGLP